LPMRAEHPYVPAMNAELMTAEELLKANIPNKRTELVRGRLVVREPAGWRHGAVTMNLTIRLGQHVDLTGAGQLLAAETGFTLARNPDTVRAPDIAFVRRERLPADTVAFADLAPDLVVEVLSPDDRPGETLAKIGDWLEAGAQRVWVIDPERRIARIYRQDGTETLIEATGSLQGEDVLPGFSCSLASILR
jgi:Uma2 family endonuclease